MVEWCKVVRPCVKVLKRQQAMAWAKWWENIVLMRKARKVFARWHNRKLFAGFNNWRSLTEMLQRQRSASLRILGKGPRCHVIY